jgi:hypothetical protein
MLPDIDDLGIGLLVPLRHILLKKRSHRRAFVVLVQGNLNVLVVRDHA